MKGAIPDEQVGQRWGKVEPRTMGAKALLIRPSHQGVC